MSACWLARVPARAPLPKVCRCHPCPRRPVRAPRVRLRCHRPLARVRPRPSPPSLRNRRLRALHRVRFRRRLPSHHRVPVAHPRIHRERSPVLNPRAAVAIAAHCQHCPAHFPRPLKAPARAPRIAHPAVPARGIVQAPPGMPVRRLPPSRKGNRARVARIARARTLAPSPVFLETSRMALVAGIVQLAT